MSAAHTNPSSDLRVGHTPRRTQDTDRAGRARGVRGGVLDRWVERSLVDIGYHLVSTIKRPDGFAFLSRAIRSAIAVTQTAQCESRVVGVGLSLTSFIVIPTGVSLAASPTHASRGSLMSSMGALTAV